LLLILLKTVAWRPLPLLLALLLLLAGGNPALA